MVKGFRSMVSVMDEDKQRIRTVLTPGKLNTIKFSLRQTQVKYIRKLQLEQGISYGSGDQSVRHHLKSYLYRVQSVRELCPSNKGKKLHFCVWFRRFILNNIQKRNDVHFSDLA
ncbi:hypothetical protein NPIL_139031 [Nephila pilipes]|uniref:Uncharacterized protein n=1 Tax=Nephila pilipes TaxID=299642 RepID=A0A8X6NZC6_NEPPI|nr:hypothetical protein NPIL_139031 [Nephila pilipes]